MKHSDKEAPFGAFSVVCIMQGFKIIIFYFPKAVIEVLLCAAAAVSADDAGAFAAGLAVWEAVLLFCALHENHPFVFC